MLQLNYMILSEASFFFFFLRVGLFCITPKPLYHRTNLHANDHILTQSLRVLKINIKAKSNYSYLITNVCVHVHVHSQ